MKVLLSVALLWSSTWAPAAGLRPSGAQVEPEALSQRQDTTWLARTSAPDSLFSDWRPLSFGGDRGETTYVADSVGGIGCLRAQADQGGSGLIRLLETNPDSTARVGWRWWIEGPVPGGDLTRKEGDDFAARVYVNFRFESSKAGVLHRIKQRLANRKFGGEAPGKALVYVWGNAAPVGTLAFSAYTDQAALFVVRSGTAGAGTWWTEERDFRADYREAFENEPPSLHSVAIMTDADDTGSTASACYGDIFFLSSLEPPPG